MVLRGSACQARSWALTLVLMGPALSWRMAPVVSCGGPLCRAGLVVGGCMWGGMPGRPEGLGGALHLGMHPRQLRPRLGGVWWVAKRVVAHGWAAAGSWLAFGLVWLGWVRGWALGATLANVAAASCGRRG